MSTFEGVPIATYGLTGIMIIALTGLTFFDSKGEQGDLAGVVATASVPSFMGSVLTPSAPSFLDTVMGAKDTLAQAVTGKKEESSMFGSPFTDKKEEPSMFGDPFSGKKEEPSMFGSPFSGKKEEPSMFGDNKEEPSMLGSLSEKAKSAIDEGSKLTDFTKNREEEEEPTPIAKFGGKNKSTSIFLASSLGLFFSNCSLP